MNPVFTRPKTHRLHCDAMLRFRNLFFTVSAGLQHLRVS